MPTKETKQIDLGFELKQVSEEGTFTGLASTYDNIDIDGDVVRPGAFTKSLKETKTVPILLSHDKSKVIGEGILRDGKEGLTIEGTLDIDIDPLAQQTHAKMKRGRIKGLSIGFTTQKMDHKGGVRNLRELRVWEVSLTAIPANPAAVVTGIKESSLASEPEGTLSEPSDPVAQAETKSIEPETHSLLESLSRTLKGK